MAGGLPADACTSPAGRTVSSWATFGNRPRLRTAILAPQYTAGRGPEDARSTQPEVQALLHASRGVGAYTRPGDAALAPPPPEFDQAVELAGAHDLGYLEVQTLWMVATLPAIHGDLRGRNAPPGTRTAPLRRTAARCRHPGRGGVGPATSATEPVRNRTPERGGAARGTAPTATARTTAP